jgi:UDP-N-acetylmuramate dehydrogenase
VDIEEHMVVPNTFRVGAAARYGCHAASTQEIKQAIGYASTAELDFIALGQGSNIIPRSRINGFVCLVRSRGVDVIREEADQVVVRVAAGENWHDLVLSTLSAGWYGLENLALIPGSVGAAPVQNIGAYGVDLAPFIEAVEVVDRSGQERTLAATDCEFRYRDSVFKGSRELTICTVVLRLNNDPAVVTHYPELRAELDVREIEAPTPAEVADAVITIRRRKLPDPASVPNVGSFFKNPVVGTDLAQRLRSEHPHFNSFAVDGGLKLSAAQLIDAAGWKKKPAPKVACWQQQPLVLVNAGQASSEDVLAFAEAIRKDIHARFSVQLELEPSLLS